MKTHDHNTTATFTKRHVVALVISSVFVSVLVGESRKLARDYRTWLMWLLTAMFAAVLAASASTLWRRRSRQPNEES
jgi:hypothetical protein